MRIRKPRPVRNKIDLADPKQVRLVRKRLGLSYSDLLRIVGKMGNSLASISKEVELERLQTSVSLDPTLSKLLMPKNPQPKLQSEKS